MKSPGRQSKDAIYEQFARIGSAVTCPKRLELLDLLCQGPKNGEALVRETGMSLANTSQHLQTLRAARLVEADKEGLHVIYRPVDRMVCEFFRSTRVPAENRLAEIESIKRQFSMEGKWKNAKQSSGTESKGQTDCHFRGYPAASVQQFTEHGS
jgi:DNA-binding transcriptional ArsR family regulator